MSARFPRGMAWHGYIGGKRHIEVFRNPRRFQNTMSRYIMYRCFNHSSEGFPTWEEAKERASRLNPKLEWRLEPEDPYL